MLKKIALLSIVMVNITSAAENYSHLVGLSAAAAEHKAQDMDYGHNGSPSKASIRAKSDNVKSPSRASKAVKQLAFSLDAAPTQRLTHPKNK